MEFLSDDDLVRPFVFSARPTRQRRNQLDIEQGGRSVYIDGKGLLVPATMGPGLHRSISASGQTGRRSPMIVINNRHDDNHSPVHPGRRRSFNYDRSYSSDESSDRERSHSRQRRSRHREKKEQKEIDPAIKAKMDRLELLERKEEEVARRKKYEEEQLLKAAAEKKRKEKEEELKKLAITEYNTKQLEKEAKEKKEKEEADKAFQDRVRATFRNAGYSEESIERILEKEGKGANAGQKKIMDLTRPTYIKVHRKYLSPDTLDVYDLPWEWDDVSLCPHLKFLYEPQFLICLHQANFGWPFKLHSVLGLQNYS